MIASLQENHDQLQVYEEIKQHDRTAAETSNQFELTTCPAYETTGPK